jgi:hypothetical protein
LVLKAKNLSAAKKGTYNASGAKSNVVKLGSAPKKTVQLGRAVKPTTYKIGTYRGSTIEIGIPKKSYDTLKAVIPKRTSTDTLNAVPIPLRTNKNLGLKLDRSGGVISNKTLQFKTPAAPVPKTATKKKSSSSSGGDGKVVTIKKDSANKYFSANPGARAKDFVPSLKK